jgi:uncharacterized Fe-S cluster protein YjdI
VPSGSEPEPRHAHDVERIYHNDEVEVTWNPALCIHYGACVGGSAHAFDPRRRPWIDVNAETANRIAEIIDGCPTGALHARLLQGEQPVDDEPVAIWPQQDGPLFVRGHVWVVGPDGVAIREDTRMALCRCGASQNKPYCDDSHFRIGFKSG